MMLSKLKRLLSRFKLIRLIPMFREYILDLRRFYKYSGTFRIPQNHDAFRAMLTMEYHCIEKALSLKETRVGFAKQKVGVLIKNLKEYISLYGVDETAQVVMNVLSSYERFHADKGYPDKNLRCTIEELKSSSPASTSITEGGILHKTKKEITMGSSIDFEAFTSSRYSIRDFDSKAVDLQLIREAVRLALKTPSVCNRQPWRVHAYADSEQKKRAISFQVGNKGFGEDAGVILVVTSPLSSFFGTGERSEPYIDGGMFSMSLVYALHNLGLGCCCLNLCTKNKLASEFRKACNIPENEALVMMIAVGHIPDLLDVAVSHRKPVDEVLCLH